MISVDVATIKDKNSDSNATFASNFVYSVEAQYSTSSPLRFMLYRLHPNWIFNFVVICVLFSLVANLFANNREGEPNAKAKQTTDGIKAATTIEKNLQIYEK